MKNQALLSLLDTWQLDRDDLAEWVGNWPDEQVAEFLEQAGAVLEETTKTSCQQLINSPNALVLYPDNRSKFKSSILRRCLLYADFTVVSVGFPNLPAPWTPKFQKEQIAYSAQDIMNLRPFLRAGKCLAVGPNVYNELQEQAIDEIIRRLCRRDTVRSIIRSNAQLGTRTIKIPATGPNDSTTEIDLDQILATFDKYHATKIAGQIPPAHTAHLPLIPVHGEFAVPSEDQIRKRPDLRDALDSVVTSRIESLIRDWAVGTGLLRGELVCNTEVGWQLLQELETQERAARNLPTQQVLIELELPFLDELPPELIAEHRDKSRNELMSLRHGLATLAIEAGKALEAGLDQREVRVLQEKHVHGPIRDLDIRLQEIKKECYTKLVGSVVLGTSMMAIALFAGHLPAAIAASASLGALLGRGQATSAIAQLMRERASVKRSPMYMLWRLRKNSGEG